jgi:Arc/MetJ-type ribon-helix-helix transcriptional regulator
MEETVIMPLEISLPESVKAAINRRVESAGFASPAAYVRALVLADLDRAGSATVREAYPELSPDTLAKIQVGLDELDGGLGIKVDDLF